MSHKVFIPVSDELLFDRPDLINAPLRPYKTGMACYHWLDISLNPDQPIRKETATPAVKCLHTLKDVAHVDRNSPTVSVAA